jgi:hypothetical protein
MKEEVISLEIQFARWLDILVPDSFSQLFSPRSGKDGDFRSLHVLYDRDTARVI